MTVYAIAQLTTHDRVRYQRYAKRQSTQGEHAAEIRQVYGYRDLTDEGPQQGDT